MSRESGIAIAGALLVGSGLLLAFLGGAFEPREPDISGALEWLSAEGGRMPSDPQVETLASRPMAMKPCAEALKTFTSRYPDLEAVWVRRPELLSVSFPGAGDHGATIKVECSRARQALTISQHR